MNLKEKQIKSYSIQGEQQDNEASDVNQEENNNENGDSSEQPAENQETNDESNAKDSNDPVMEIEGIVHGEADNNVVQSASRFSSMDDDDNKVCQSKIFNCLKYNFKKKQKKKTIHQLLINIRVRHDCF